MVLTGGTKTAPAVVAGAPCTGFRHDPYAPVVFIDEDDVSALKSYDLIYPRTSAAPVQEPVVSSDGFVLPLPASVVAAATRAKAALTELHLDSTEEGKRSNDCSVDDGVSEVSSELGHAPRQTADVMRESGSCDLFTQTASSTMMDLPLPAAAPSMTLLRYASVNFRFGSAWFLAPFRTFVGDMVVVEYPSNHSLHMGLVSCISTEKPSTFYSDDNMDPNFLTTAEMQVLPRILRHARDCDKLTKLDLRSHDLRSLASAQALAEEMQAPVMFLDAEWLLDLTAVTFLVHVYGDVALVDRLADELAAQEGAEVVFTYPSTSTKC